MISVLAQIPAYNQSPYSGNVLAVKKKSILQQYVTTKIRNGHN